MRHYFLSRPVAALPRGVHSPAASGLLVALTGRDDSLPPGSPGAAVVAVHLASVAAAADDHLIAATRTQEQAAGSGLGLRCIADEAWTNSIIGRILVLHSCPARCAARRRCRTSRLSSAPCLPSSLAGSRTAVLPDPGVVSVPRQPPGNLQRRSVTPQLADRFTLPRRHPRPLDAIYARVHAASDTKRNRGKTWGGWRLRRAGRGSG
jgi:hypothetical protein